MPFLPINAIVIGARRRGVNWVSYWATQPEVLFFGLYSEIADGKMPNKVNGATDYLTVAGSAGFETYQCPNTAPYIAADTDYIWFSVVCGSQRTVSTAELIGYDLQKTPVKYEDSAPNEIVAIMILSSAVTGDKKDRMFQDFWLPILWDNSLNANGHVKSNRLAYTPLMPEIITNVDDREFSSDTGFWEKITYGGTTEITGGVAKFINAAQFNQIRKLNFAVVGEKYWVKYSIKNYSSGQVEMKIGNTADTRRNANGNYTAIMVATVNSTVNFYEYTTSGGNYEIDNVSMKKIPY